MKNKKDIAKKIAEEKGITTQAVLDIINDFVKELQNAILKREKVNISGLGIFHPKTIKSRWGINPRKPKEKLKQPERKSVRFALAKPLKDKLNE